tara:strand:+ start:786 stop:1103 length:318 start_codon:yes stop_codon:yes gene_type:complete
MAYKYAISFRIGAGTHGGSTYSERYASFMEQVRKTGAWEETTSFALIVSDETLESLVTRLYIHSKFNATADLMIVIDIERAVAVTKGTVEYPHTLGLKLNKLAQK